MTNEYTNEQLSRAFAGSSRKGVELCTLVVAGGPVTLHTVNFMLRRKKPVVVLKGSGGVADLLSYACENIAHVPYSQCVTDLATNTKRCVCVSLTPCLQRLCECISGVAVRCTVLFIVTMHEYIQS